MKFPVTTAFAVQKSLINGYVTAEAPLVTIQNGTIRGRHDAAYNHDLFLGVPYARPPIGNNRFRAPEPYNESWNGALDAVAFGFSCPGY